MNAALIAELADGTGPRSVLLPPGAVDFSTCQEIAESRGGAAFAVRCTGRGVESLAPVAELLAELLPTLVSDAPGLVERWAPELAATAPDAAAAAGIRPEHPLDELANTPSERRSHRESEQMFRIANGIGQLLHEALDVCPVWKSGPLVLLWESLHAADPASLLVFRRLSRWANQSGSRLLLVATLDRDGVPDAGPLAATEPAGCFAWQDAHRELVTAVREQFLGVDHSTAGKASDEGPGREGTIGSALGALHAGDVERGAVLAIRAMQPAAFRLNYEAVLLLAGQVLAAAGQRELDPEALERAWRETEPASYYAALEFAVTPPRDGVEVRLAAWHAAGFANSCLLRHESALECYRQALATATTTLQRSRARMYLGLITGKRLARIEEAESHIRRAIADLEEATDPVEVLERGWLLNVNALMAYRTRRHREAMKMVRRAWQDVKDLKSSEATHLKVNLLSNMTVLYEKTGRLDDAVRNWTKFGVVLRRANELFAKHYRFREGGLLMLAGRLPEALEAYRLSYEQCTATEDPLHARFAAQACAHLARRLGNAADAVLWCERAVAAARSCGDHEFLPVGLTALATTARQAGMPDLAEAARTEAEALGEQLGLPAVREDADLLPEPATKLNRPFNLTNTYVADASA